MKVALVHDFLTQLGGAERVLQTVHELFPEAPVYTLVYDQQKTQGVFDKWEIRPSFLQKLPGMPRNYKWYLSLMSRAIKNFDLSSFDLVFSDSSAFAKGVITKKPTIHICYCHTPTRYLWQDLDSYVTSAAIAKPFKVLVKPYFKYYLRNWDYQAAQRPDFFIANSRTVHERIKKYYHRDSAVIYPPVDTGFFKSSGSKADYYFTASRLEPYKKIDLVIEAFSQLNLPLKIGGEGSGFLKLKSKILNPKIEFLGRVSDDELRRLYSEARAFIFPALEDAGIMILESLACGTPVIGFAQGGTVEFIADGENGILFSEQIPEAIMAAVKRFELQTFNPTRLRESALSYDKEIFKEKIRKVCALALTSGH